MRNRLPLAIAAVLAVLLGWRACAGRGGPEHQPAAEPAPVADAAAPARDAPAAAARQMTAPTRQALSGASATVHSYLADLASRDLVRADRWWADGNPGQSPGDAVLRALPAIRSMKINTGVARALDAETPPRAVEVPVRLRLDMGDQRSVHMRGHYWLRAHAGGGGWAITSASLDPELD